MNKLFAMGEALIDFIPNERDSKLKEVSQFQPQVGGAPTNVASCVAKLGGNASIITQVGEDAFGEKIEDTLNTIGVDTNYLMKTDKATTALAFVSLTKEGERDFAFYRKPSADMLLKTEDLPDLNFSSTDILHFCSVDLVESPMKQTHMEIIDKRLKENGTVVFDPNLRFPLWDSLDDLRETVLDFIPKAHIVKISDEELEFITNLKDENETIESLFVGNVEIIIYTEGKNGASIYTKNGMIARENGFEVTVKDTTGAGDAFIGAIIFQLLKEDRKHLTENGNQYLRFANAVGGVTTTAYGTIESLPYLEDVENLMKNSETK